jgi:hypothetical protein
MPWPTRHLLGVELLLENRSLPRENGGEKNNYHDYYFPTSFQAVSHKNGGNGYFETYHHVAAMSTNE